MNINNARDILSSATADAEKKELIKEAIAKLYSSAVMWQTLKINGKINHRKTKRRIKNVS